MLSALYFLAISYSYSTPYHCHSALIHILHQSNILLCHSKLPHTESKFLHKHPVIPLHLHSSHILSLPEIMFIYFIKNFTALFLSNYNTSSSQSSGPSAFPFFILVKAFLGSSLLILILVHNFHLVHPSFLIHLLPKNSILYFHPLSTHSSLFSTFPSLS